jgi:nitrite reductase/ring-hydroxylating ferredoxin subunit
MFFARGIHMAMHTACRSEDVGVGQMKAFTVDGHKIVLYHLTDGFFATQASCSHIFAPLVRGKLLDDRSVQCPFHRARFDIRTGKVVDWANFPPGIQMLNVVRGEKALRTYKVSVEGGSVNIDIPGDGP